MFLLHRGGTYRGHPLCLHMGVTNAHGNAVWVQGLAFRRGREHFRLWPASRAPVMAAEFPPADPFQLDFDPPNPNLYSDFDSLPLPDEADLTFPDGFMADLGFQGDNLDFSIEDLLASSPFQWEEPHAEDFNGGSGISYQSQVSDEQRADDGGNLNSMPTNQVSDVSACGGRSQGSKTASPASLGRESSGSLSDGASWGNSRGLNSPAPIPGCQGGDFLANGSDDRSSSDSQSPGSASPEVSRPASCDRKADVAEALDHQLLGSGGSDRRISGSSGSQLSDAERILDSPSPDSGSVSSFDSSNVIPRASADQEMKLEEGGKACILKRKKGKDDGNPNQRNTKFQKSIPTEDGNATSPGDEEEDKKKARLMRNRESAQLSRQRKKHYVEELEDKVRSMHCTIADLNNKISFVMAENASLRQQLSGGSVRPPQPAAGVYPPPPMVPMQFPWVPCPSYPLKPQGSQVPLIPIPRLKSQQPVSASKAKKVENKKAEGKRSECKTKKVPSVSFMGLLFLLLIFGGFVPFVNHRYEGIRNSVSGGSDFVNYMHGGQSHGRVLRVAEIMNGSSQNDENDLFRANTGYGERSPGQSIPSSDGFGLKGNASEHLVASLYVPRNDRLVKIDGNLIIHSVLASERAMASSNAESRIKNDKHTTSCGKGAGDTGLNKHTTSSSKEAGETGLAITRHAHSALAISRPGRDVDRHSGMYRSTTERPKALSSSSGDSYGDKTAAEGALQQWFREGLAGPILSSGVCTEVFQFEISPASANRGAIIPAGPFSNDSVKQQPSSSTKQSKMKNRRFLYNQPIPLNGSSLNSTAEPAAKPPTSSTTSSLSGNKSSSMVVSVLVDPREAGDGGGEGDVMMGPKSLSRIFVVVLLDSVKYVTYSCVLPMKGAAGPHLVAVWRLFVLGHFQSVKRMINL
ncbi:hypothetical protein ACLOJK_024783 [Asimina triloba]